MPLGPQTSCLLRPPAPSGFLCLPPPCCSPHLSPSLAPSLRMEQPCGDPSLPSCLPWPPLQCFFPPLIILLFEVNHFFLKAELWVPPINPLNTYRLTILFLFALPGIKVRPAWLCCQDRCARHAWPATHGMPPPYSAALLPRLPNQHVAAASAEVQPQVALEHRVPRLSALLAAPHGRRSTTSSWRATPPTSSPSWAPLPGWQWPSPLWRRS